MIYGEKIKQARELEGLTQKTLAGRLRVHTSAVGQMEVGLYSATPEHLQALAFATGFPPSFFEDSLHLEFPAGSLLFRARQSKMTQRDRAQAHRYGQTMFELYSRLSAKLKPTELTIPRVSGETPRKAATITRSSIGLSPDSPIENLINAVERAGVLVLGLPVVLPDRDAFSVWAEGKPVIAVSDGLPGDRIRFSVAHELGHLVMHKSAVGLVSVLEKEANEFASELLLPYGPVLSQLIDGVSLSGFTVLKKQWGVSIQTIARRARDVGKLSERQYHAIFEQLAKLGIPRKKESDYVAVPREKPRRLRQIIERYYGIPVDINRLATDVHLKPAFLRRVLDVHAEGRKPVHKGTTALPFRRPGR